MPLDPTDLSALSRLLDEALDLGPGQAEAWLAALPDEHRHLLPRLRAMLAEHLAQGAAGFMSTGPKLDERSAPADESVAHADDLVGPYRLIREIGRGGMGAVWLAERADGSLKRLIALKLPRLAWGAGLAERMARERDIGALLEHPNIARLYDAGVDALGRPYLALEYIDGQPLDAWCETKALSVAQRLRLFLQVAHAVAYAHGRLVVHRDLKPSNVLVTADGQAHLLDFGIAKLLHEASPGDERLTQEQGRVLTPHYASPEQIRGESITVQSDVYSLGVLLYELLTGQYPHVPERKGLAALEEAILSDEAPPASGRTQDRNTAKALRGEIDAILSKALKREPSQRYATADAFAADIERHLNGDAVLAQPDSVGYRMTKAIKRHRVGFAAGAAILLAVLTGAGVSIVQAKRANDAAERARVVKEFVVDVFKINERGNPANNELRQLPAELLLERGARLIETKFPGQPQLQAELYGVVGGIFADMASPKLAAEYATKQIEALTATGARDEELAGAMLLLAQSLADQDRLSDAALRVRRALELSSRQLNLQVRARAALAGILVAQEKHQDAVLELDRIDREIDALRRPLSEEIAVSHARALALRAQLAHKFSKVPSDAEALYDKAIAAALAAQGPASLLAAAIRLDYAYVLAGEFRGVDAQAQLAAALAAMRMAGGADDIGASLAQTRVVAMLFDSGQISFQQALAAVTEARSALERQGSRVPESLRARINFDLGWIYRIWGDVERAYMLQKDAVAALRPATESLFMQRVLDESLGLDAMLAGHHDEADTLLRRGLELRKVEGINEGNLAIGYTFVAVNHVMQRRFDEAEQVLSAAPPADPWVILLRATIKVERGDGRGALELLKPLDPPSAAGKDFLEAERLRVNGLALCATGDHLQGLAILESYANKRSETVFEHEPELALVRAEGGLCALAAGQRKRAFELAALARKAFVVQPGVSEYYKAPLAKLERALQARRPGG